MKRITILILFLSVIGQGQVITTFYTKASSPIMAATGGTVTTDGDYKIHKFTSTGTFSVSRADQGVECSVLVVAGGGGGASASSGGFNNAGGGGGGGGAGANCAGQTTNSVAGGDNTGGGGGGGCYTSSTKVAANGGSGIVIIKYKYK